MTEYGIYDLDGVEEPTLPHQVELTSPVYERLIDRYPEIGLWCIEHQMRVEVVEDDDMEGVSGYIRRLEQKGIAGIPRDVLNEEIMHMMLSRHSHVLFFPNEDAAFEFKVRWL